CAIFFCRSSTARMSGGQMKLIVNKTSRMKTIIWMMSVRLMFTLVSRCEYCEARQASPPRRASRVRQARPIIRRSVPGDRVQRREEGIRKHEEQREPNAYHRNRV